MSTKLKCSFYGLDSLGKDLYSLRYAEGGVNKTATLVPLKDGSYEPVIANLSPGVISIAKRNNVLIVNKREFSRFPSTFK